MKVHKKKPPGERWRKTGREDKIRVCIGSMEAFLPEEDGGLVARDVALEAVLPCEEYVIVIDDIDHGIDYNTTWHPSREPTIKELNDAIDEAKAYVKRIGGELE